MADEQNNQTVDQKPSPKHESVDLSALKAATPEPSLNDVENEIEQLRGELEQTKDHALRAHAELENYRKRVAREMNDERRYANLSLLRDLLPVLDNIQRAIEASEKNADASRLLQGFQMVARQLETVLQQYHCERIDALHQPFDPALHQAIAQQPSADFPPNTVIHVALPGYRLHDRVVRASQVVVSGQREQA